ncbi:MAG: hypothetical protein V2A34_14910 [Lentisphaerota bacterium]
MVKVYGFSLMAAAALIMAGCEDSIDDTWTPIPDATPTPSPTQNTNPTNNNSLPVPTPTPVPSNNSTWPSNLTSVSWLHTDVSGWKQTSTLRVSFSGDMINLKYDKANVWPENGGVNANPWIFVFQDGTWYAGTWEWLRVGQTAKPKNVVNGDHIKRDPLGGFQPVSGQIYGFMVSGLARDDRRNAEERTNIEWVRWP